MIDPFGNAGERRDFPSFGTSSDPWFREPFPSVECDVVLVTHPHFDHDAVDRVRGVPSVLRSPLELGEEDFRIRGFMGRHARHFGKEFGQRNVVFTVETAGLTFCHTGDNRAELPKGMSSIVEKVDVLMVPVDETNHLLTYREVDDVVRTMNPKIVMPTHYRVPGLTDSAAPLGGIRSWLAAQSNVRFFPTPCVELSVSDLPGEREVWTFEGLSDANKPG